MFVTEPPGDVIACKGEQAIRDLQPLSAGLGAEDCGHLVVHQFDVSGIKLSGRLLHWALTSDLPRHRGGPIRPAPLGG